MKSMIIYRGRYGATRQYAEWLHQKLALTVRTTEDCTAEELRNAELLVLGSSVYIGKLEMTKWIRQHLDYLRGRQLILFVVSGTPSGERDKLQGYIKSSVPAVIAEKCKIFFLEGRLDYQKLSLKDRFMLRVGAFFAGKINGRKMLKGYDGVKEENLAGLYKYLETTMYQQV
ncbi:flavodoxin domain-containing protein [Terrimonas sp. NA20]|uniref:Flavodoxin domain-containing protein n=1 Tax=Terrimonas ginsenosidimutans TaxID=2908004 RepID=A0ABS9KVF0_9BACT|nr:flavodoxin domain-containing protein [Terrimonas ginsenosidimutans]MCG2616295.1 flavodoxin domain-containing protein [Terrimonas ginsenosidimutans]